MISHGNLYLRDQRTFHNFITQNPGIDMRNFSISYGRNIKNGNAVAKVMKMKRLARFCKQGELTIIILMTISLGDIAISNGTVLQDKALFTMGC
jgi:hypothetical protein